MTPGHKSLPVKLPPIDWVWAGGACGQTPAAVAAGHVGVCAGLGREGNLPVRHLLDRGQEGMGGVHLIFFEHNNQLKIKYLKVKIIDFTCLT